MKEVTKDELRDTADAGSDLRDVAGAWLVRALVAAIALPVVADLQPPPASTPVATGLMQALR
jgi:hypothetical protein